MLKERAEVSDGPRTGPFECSRLDTVSEALPNDRVYSRYQFGKGSRNVAIGRGQHSERQTKQARVAQAICRGFVRDWLGEIVDNIGAKEIEVSQHFWELVADQDASGQFCAQFAGRCSARSRSTQLGEHRVLQDPGQRRTVNSQSLPILDVPSLLELIHKITNPAPGRANQSPECLMTDLRDDRGWLADLVVAGD